MNRCAPVGPLGLASSPVMVCGHCGASAQEGQKFCGQCGRQLVATCPNCGFDNPPDHRFCGSCGTALGDTSPSVAPSATERRVVSVLFVDLVGFTSYSEHRDTEEVRGLITEYFDLARDVIERFGGTVDKFIGDAVMAWWGATTAREDDAERAVRSALEVIDAVTSLGDRRGIDGLAARAGVMTGEVAVGPGGNEKGLLLGDLVNSTSRLQSLAEPGTVLVGESTAALVRRSIEVEPAGTHQVKGKEDPITAWQATRVLSELGGRGRVEMLEPPFTGRASELRLLKDALHATGREQRSRLVSLVGQAGIGKSRLIREFSNYIDGLVEPVYWHEGRSPSYGDGLALWALGEMVRGRARLQETDPPEVTAARLDEAVAEFVPEAETGWVRDRLAALLGLGGSVGGERTELFAAARAFFEGIAGHGTTILVFEDLHWADPSMLEFIEELPDWSRNHPILVVTMSRPDLLDRRPDWGSGRPGFTSIYLGPLAGDEMVDLIAGAVKGLPAEAVERIAAAAEGVPLFAVEMLRSLIGDGRLVVGESGVTVEGDLTQIEVPGSVQAVIAARLDRLPPEERNMVRDAAVLGYSFTIDALSSLREESLDKIERRLGDLVRHEILTVIRDPRSPEHGQYQWVQSVLREVAYGRISRADRHDLHLKVARYMRDLEDPELAPVAAAHFVAASEVGQGDGSELQAELIASLRAAIDRVRALHAHEQVLSLVRVALPVADTDQAGELHEYAALAAVRLSDFEVARDHTGAISRLAESSGSEPLLHRSMALKARVANDFRRSGEVVEELKDHIERYPEFDADPHLAEAAVGLARAMMLSGEDEAAAVMADRALGAVEKLNLIEAVADAMVTRGTALSATRYHQAMALLRGALDICREHDLMDTKLRTLINIGYASQDYAETMDASMAAFEEARRVGDRNHASFVAGNLVGALIWELRLDQAESLLDDPVWSPRPSDQMLHEALYAEVALRRGDRPRADRHLVAAQAVRDSDPQALANLERTVDLFALFDGDYQPVFETGRRQFRESPWAPWLSMWFAVTGAALMGEPHALEEARAMAASLPPGQLNTPSLDLAEIMLAMIDGDVDVAVARVDGLWGATSGAELVWHELITKVAVARHLPPGHEARARYLSRIEEITVPKGALGVWEWAQTAIDG